MTTIKFDLCQDSFVFTLFPNHLRLYNLDKISCGFNFAPFKNIKFCMDLVSWFKVYYLLFFFGTFYKIYPEKLFTIFNFCVGFNSTYFVRFYPRQNLMTEDNLAQNENWKPSNFKVLQTTRRFLGQSIWKRSMPRISGMEWHVGMDVRPSLYICKETFKRKTLILCKLSLNTKLMSMSTTTFSCYKFLQNYAAFVITYFRANNANCLTKKIVLKILVLI